MSLFSYPLTSSEGLSISFDRDPNTGALRAELTALGLENNPATLLAQASKFIELTDSSGPHRFVKSEDGRFYLDPPPRGVIGDNLTVSVRDVDYGTVYVGANNELSSKITHQLSAFETRVMSQGRNGVYPLVERDLAYTPRTDLHTHLAGALSGEDLIRVGLAKEGEPVVYPESLLAEAGIDTSAYAQTAENGRIALKDLSVTDLAKLADSMSIPMDTQDTFNGMEKIYALRGPITKDNELFKPLLWELARDFQKNGVTYSEQSFSAIINDPELMRIAHTELPKIEAETGVKIRFLAGMWRHSDQEWNGDEVDRIKAIAKSPYVAGIDIMGHETNPTRDVVDQIKAVAKWSIENDPDFVIRVHAGENPLFAAEKVDAYSYNNVREALTAVLEARAEIAAERGVAPESLRLPNIRIGHGLYGADEETIRLFKETNATVEFNMTSNLSLNNVDHLGEVPLKKYQDAGVRLVLGSDGAGLYRTNAGQEALLAAHAGLDERGFATLREIETQYIRSQAESFANKSLAFDADFEAAKSMSDEPWKTVFEPTYSTIDGKPRMNAEVAASKRQALEDHLNGIRAAVAENGIVTDPVQVEKITAGKRPIMITGASKSSWPLISDANQQEIRVAMQLLVDHIDPAKAYIVTGGTNFGVEQQMHEVAASRNAVAPENQKLVVLGTLTMEAKPEEIVRNTVTHAQILELNGRPAARWFDLPDATLSMLEAKNGVMVAVGGGPVVRDMITRGHNMRTPMMLMNGPEGASTDKAEQLAGRGYEFEGAEALLKRLHAENPGLFKPGFDPQKLSQYRTDAQIRYQSDGNDAELQRVSSESINQNTLPLSETALTKGQSMSTETPKDGIITSAEVVVRDGISYTRINPDSVDFSRAERAQKLATVYAVQVTEPTPVTTLMPDGHIETTNTANAGDWIVSNIDNVKPKSIPGYDSMSPEEQIQARAQRAESYVLSPQQFSESNTIQEAIGKGFAAKASSEPRLAATIPFDFVIQAPWGEDQFMRAGSVIVNNGPTDIYSVDQQAFQNTYGEPGASKPFAETHAETIAAGKPLVRLAETAPVSKAGPTLTQPIYDAMRTLQTYASETLGKPGTFNPNLSANGDTFSEMNRLIATKDVPLPYSLADFAPTRDDLMKISTLAIDVDTAGQRRDSMLAPEHISPEVRAAAALVREYTQPFRMDINLTLTKPQSVVAPFTPADIESLPRTSVVNTSVRVLKQFQLDTTEPFTPTPIDALDKYGKPVKVGITGYVRAIPDEAMRVGESGREINIAALRNSQLPPQFSGENTAAAKGAISAILENPDASRDQLASIIHDQWLERNGSWAAPELKVPYEQLSQAEKDKDLAVLDVAKSELEKSGLRKLPADTNIDSVVQNTADQLHEAWKIAYQAQNGEGAARWKQMNPESVGWVAENNPITDVEYVNPKDSTDSYAIQRYPVKDGVLVLPTSTNAQAAELHSRIRELAGERWTIDLETFDTILKGANTWYRDNGLDPDMYNSDTTKFPYDWQDGTFGGHEKLERGVYRKAGGTDEIVLVRGPAGETIGFNGGSEHVGTQYGKGEAVLLRDGKTGVWRKLDADYARENLRNPDSSAIDWNRVSAVPADIIRKPVDTNSATASIQGEAGTSQSAKDSLGNGTLAAEMRSAAQRVPDAPKYSPTAVVAANDGRAGQPMTDVADGGGKSSAAKFMQKPSASTPAVAANDIAPVPADAPKPGSSAPRAGGLVHMSAGSGTGVALGGVFSALRYAEGGSMDTAQKVGGNQLAAEVNASRADIAGMAPDAAFLATVGASKVASKVAPGLASSLQGAVSTGARLVGPVSLLAGAGVTYAEMQAAEAAQDGRREAGALYAFIGGVAGGAGTGAAYGFAGGGPWGSLIAGGVGAVGGGFLASEYGRRSQMGDQMQRDLDHRAQIAVDASIERLREIHAGLTKGETLDDTEKRDVRAIYVALLEQHSRLEVLYVPETDIDGQLRRDFQLSQTASALNFLKDPNAEINALPPTSREAGREASNRLPELVAQINARDGELNWKQSLDQDRFGKKDGIVTVAEVVKAANEYGLDLYTLDKDGKGLQLNELLSALHAVGVDSHGVSAGRTFTPNSAPMIADSVHSSFTGRPGAVHLLETLDALHIPGLNGQQLRAVMDQYGISVAMLDLKAEGKINQGDVARAFLTNGVPKETLNGLADHIIKLVPRYREGAEVWPTNDARLEKLREELKEYSINSDANNEADVSRWNQARDTALDYLVNGGTSDDARFKLTRFSVNIISTLEMEKIGMLQFMDTNRDGRIDADKEALPWLAKHKIQFSDTNGNNVIDVNEFAAGLPANVRAMIDIEKARQAEVKIPSPAPTATPAVAEAQPAPAPEEEISEIVVTASRKPQGRDR